jgi:hypothetical protein
MDAVRVTDPEHFCGHLAMRQPRRREAGRGPWVRVFIVACLTLNVHAFASLPVLRTARQAHTLPAAEASRGYPVHLSRVQVTYYDPTISCLFVMDSTEAPGW